ncbi:MAG: peptidylprolyl isomerase [Acidobacteria bacterium]|nr:peptidylprolyl isomerase [Acidobacteriota bacterium]
MKTWKALLCLFVVGLLAAVGTSQVGGQTKAPPTQSAAPTSSQGAVLDAALLHPATLQAKAPESYQVKFTTTKGNFVVKVTRTWAPLGADRFYNLVQHHFFDGASFFRVLPGFVVQFGLSAYPQVSQAWQSATIKDDPVKQSNRRGYLTFATGGANTRTTQVFINLGDNSRLDTMGFSPFGEVLQGLNVVEQLYSGYGEGAPQGRGPRQDLIGARGKAYLDNDFPKLDSIKTATLIVPEGGPAPAPTKAPAKAPAKKSS